jgi:glycosyltransferase involved in cell wall biosynthesis
VEDGRSGIVVPRRDAEATTAAIERLLRDGGLAESCGTRGREIAVERYSMEKMCREREAAILAAVG